MNGWTRKDDTRGWVELGNGTSVAFALDGNRLLGIRDVEQSGVALRNPSKVWRPYFYTPEGISYAEFRDPEVTPLAGGGVAVACRAIGIRTLRREEDDEYLCDVLDLVGPDEPVEDRLVWELRPSALDLDGRALAGFSYVYRFESADPCRRIYRIFDSASWEIGGRVAGNTLLLQGQVNPPATELKQDEYFTTACNYYGSEMGGVMGPAEKVSMQRLPRLATLQAFDFLAHDKGLLFAYFDPTIDVMSIVQKDAGDDFLHVVDELRKPLSDKFESYPKHVLFLRTDEPWPREERRNLWCRACDFVHERERARHGIQASPVLPRVWTPQVANDEYAFGDARGPRSELFRYLAEEAAPRWAAMGVKEICCPSHWVCDYTVDRFLCKNDSGLQGGITVSGICCVRVHEIDPLWGGPEAMAGFVEAAHRHGMAVQLWWATHLSRRAPIFAERPEFMVKSRDGQPGCAGIGHHVLIPMNLNHPDCFEWELGKLKAVHQATGIDGFFNDSYGNYTFLPVNYADEQRRCQQEAYGRLVHALQQAGMKTFTVEGLGPWGVGHFGMQLLATKKGGRNRYQNALDWWLGEEDMVYRLNMGIHQETWEDREQESEQFAFRCLAYGGRFGFTTRENGLEMWSGWVRDQNRMHSRIGPLSGRRDLLAGDRGVLWQRPDGEQVLFAFRAFEFPVAAEKTVRMMTGEAETAVAAPSGTLRTQAWRVYRIA